MKSRPLNFRIVYIRPASSRFSPVVKHQISARIEPVFLKALNGIAMPAYPTSGIAARVNAVETFSPIRLTFGAATEIGRSGDSRHHCQLSIAARSTDRGWTTPMQRSISERFPAVLSAPALE